MKTLTILILLFACLNVSGQNEIHPDNFGFGAGMALIIFAVFIGFTLLIYGWPKFKK